MLYLYYINTIIIATEVKDTGEEVSLHDRQEEVEVMAYEVEVMACAITLLHKHYIEVIACAITLLHEHYIATEVKDNGKEISLHEHQACAI